ncbi:protein THEM6-like isoform X1 [Cynoglossus semilaevis]|uniref:protein THEM6-like isoform X1 n=1 Tax=Cynoglossus semilaevis TaxID=244447 RepID=UPI000496813B|nr:protein THEM6-like isoform X1 [Cynoglossus semilaevis]
MLVLVLVASLLLFSVFDVWYFLRAALAVVHAWFQPRIWDILAVQSFDGIVLPHDLDKLYHMNNSRYLRECDFARLHAYTRSRLLIALFKSGGGMVIGASTIRYRRSLEIWESFQIQTKIRGWDDKAFYLEQRFVSKRDGFVSAVMFSKQNVMNSSPEILISLASKMKDREGDRGGLEPIPADIRGTAGRISQSLRHSVLDDSSSKQPSHLCVNRES